MLWCSDDTLQQRLPEIACCTFKAKLLRVNTKHLQENAKLLHANGKVLEPECKVSGAKAKLMMFYPLPGRHRVQRNWWNRGTPGCFRSCTPPLAQCQTLGHTDALAVLQAWSAATVHPLHIWVWRHATNLYFKPFTNQRKKADHYPISSQISTRWLRLLYPYLKSSSTAMKKVWKLLFRLSSVSSSIAIFPNVWNQSKESLNFPIWNVSKVSRRRGQREWTFAIVLRWTHLHSNHTIDEKDHRNE